MEKIIIIGCGGHAKSLADTIEMCGKYKIAGFISKDEQQVFSYRGYGIIGTDKDLKQIYRDGIQYASIGIGYLGKGGIRERIYDTLREIGFILPSIVDCTSIVAKDVLLGDGCFVGKRVVINSNARIGKATIINTGVVIEHDCIIDDFSHIAVAAVLCGGSEVGKSCFVGANATILQKIKVGDSSIVGAGAVVVHNVYCESVVKGVPAK